MTTDTPRTDACPHCGAEARTKQNDYSCGSWRIDSGINFRTEICKEREARHTAEAEVERLKALLRESAPMHGGWEKPEPIKILATVAFWSVPIAAVSGGMSGSVVGGVAVGVALAGLCLLTIITIDIWKE